MDIDLNLGINLGELRFQELQLVPQDGQHPAMVICQTSLQGDLHLGQLGPQPATREVRQFGYVFFPRQKLSEDGAAGHR